ncbi:Antiviral innate immune response receptor RIG-I, partial [Bulinus truncatus]
SRLQKVTLTEEEAASEKWHSLKCDGIEYVTSDNEKNKSSSAAEIVKKSSKFELRNYQKELAENALAGKNSLICAPTGSGKTRVAIHIIIQHLKNHEGKRKVAFLARTVPLLMQQYKMLRQELPDNYKITIISGRNKNSIKLHHLVPEFDVIVMTPMILYNSLKEKLLDHLGCFSLIIFDECHHTIKSNPYNLLMLSYLELKKRKEQTIQLPQIVGLTASVSMEKAVKVEEANQKVLELCGNLGVEKISIVEKFKEELECHSSNLNEITNELKEQNQTEISKKINSIMNEMEEALKQQVMVLGNEELNSLIGKIPKTKRKAIEYRQWAESVKKEAQSHKVDTETDLIVRTIRIIMNYLIIYNSSLDALDLVELKDVMRHLQASVDICKCDEKDTSMDLLWYKYFQELDDFINKESMEENRNLTVLYENLKENLKEKSHKGIIFVKTRLLSVALSSWLNRKEKEWPASPFTSANNTSGLGMSQQQQENILEAFRNGQKRILVATSVAEEGLDIPECNLVVKYNYVGNEITHIQAKGRARAKDGVSVLLAMKDILMKEILNRNRNNLMHKALEFVRTINEAELTKSIEDHQIKALKEAQDKEKLENERKKKLLHVDFTMVCHSCRKFQVHSSKIRMINKTCLAALDSSLLQHLWMFPSEKGSEEFDEIEYVADARCFSEPQPGKKCRAFLGRIIRRCNNPVLALKVKSFGFVTSAENKLQTYNQLKKVPFFVPDITNEDMLRYISEDSPDEDTNKKDEDEKNKSMHDDALKTVSHKRDHSLEARAVPKKQKVEKKDELQTDDSMSVDDVIGNIDSILE